MESGISISDLSNATEAIAETNRGISGAKLVTYCNSFASKYNIRIPHSAYPFVAGNKRSALLENLRAFPPNLQYALLMQLCEDRSLVENEAVNEIHRLIVARYGHLADEGTVTQTLIRRHSRAASAQTQQPPQPIGVSGVPPWAPKSAPKPRKPYEIFLSYSHEDEELMNLIRKQLVVYDRQNLIRKWWDRELTAGTPLDRSIKHELARSDIVLLFISASFLASDYCYEIEMKQALAQHENGRSVVVPVILRSCGWKVVPEIAELLALPKDGRPLVLWPDRDEAANNVADGVMKIVAELHAKQAVGIAK